MMALIFADSFDHYGTGATGAANMIRGAWADLDNGACQPVTTVSRTGNCSLRTPSNGIARVPIGALKSLVGVGIGIYMQELVSSNVLVGFSLSTQSDSDIVSIVPTTDGAIQVKRGGSSGTVLGISDSVLTASTFHHIEIKAVIDNIVGSVEVRVNGIVELLLTDLDLGSTLAANVKFWQTSSANSINVYWDDLTIWDDTGDTANDFLGHVRVGTFFSPTVGSNDDWDKIGAATAPDCVDEIPQDADTTYVGSSVVNDKVSFLMPELPPETVIVKGVFVPALARVEQAGIGNIQLSVISNSEVATGPAITLTPSYSYSRSVFDHDPDTDAEWTKETFEAAELVIEKVS